MEPPRLVSKRLILTIPGPERAEAYLAWAEANREAHARFNAPYAKGFFTLDYWKKRLADQLEEFAQDQTCCLTLSSREDPEGVLGNCNFTKFVRGRFQACYLGYSLDATHQGKGWMTEALETAIPYVFDELKMHRIMANYVPENLPSERLLERLGFVKEGIAKDYLYVAGGWSDHVLTSLTNPRPMVPEFS